ncbi:MAG: hypothetical protein ACXW1W_02705 [Methylococcaceae bacterium]
MEFMFLKKIVTSLGIQGFALAVFYLIFKSLNLPPPTPEWVGPIIIVALILSAVITLYVPYPRNVITQSSGKISKDRRDKLNAVWKGELKQASCSNTPVRISLKADEKNITGEMECDYDDLGKQTFDVSGSFHEDRFLKLDYANKDKGAVHFGTFLFELHPFGSTLTGECVGYGVKTGGIVTANLILNRQ